MVKSTHECFETRNDQTGAISHHKCLDGAGARYEVHATLMCCSSASRTG